MNPVIQLIEYMRRAHSRRSLARILSAMSDHQLRDIGIERKFIDEAVALDMPGVAQTDRLSYRVPNMCEAPVLRVCG